VEKKAATSVRPEALSVAQRAKSVLARSASENVRNTEKFRRR
jgi:hypothetical protein